MKIFWLIIVIVFAVWLRHYILTLEERRRNEEIIRLLQEGVQERIDMERRMDEARREGERRRKAIELIAEFEDNKTLWK